MFHDLNIEEIIRTIGVLGIAAIVFAESGLLVGFFLPGDSLLFAVGFLASQGVVETNLVGLISLLFIAAVIGDSVGYSIGLRFGRRLFKRPDSLFFNHKNLERAENFYEKYGPITIILARFTPLVRTFAPTVAGIAKMKYSTFLTYNVIGGALWTSSITLLGYYGGAFLESRGINVEALVLPIILLAILITLASPVYHILKDPSSREILLKKLKLKSRSTDK